MWCPTSRRSVPSASSCRTAPGTIPRCSSAAAHATPHAPQLLGSLIVSMAGPAAVRLTGRADALPVLAGPVRSAAARQPEHEAERYDDKPPVHGGHSNESRSNRGGLPAVAASSVAPRLCRDFELGSAAGITFDKAADTCGHRMHQQVFGARRLLTREEAQQHVAVYLPLTAIELDAEHDEIILPQRGERGPEELRRLANAPLPARPRPARVNAIRSAPALPQRQA